MPGLGTSKLQKKSPAGYADRGHFYFARGGQYYFAQKGQIRSPKRVKQTRPVQTWYKLEDNALRIGQSTAWHEREGFREFLERTFPSMKIYYLDVEPEAGYYFTNDVERKYFPGDYLLEIVKGDVYFPEFEPRDTIEQAAERVSAIIGKQLPADEDAVRAAIDEFMNAQKDTALALHRYERGE